MQHMVDNYRFSVSAYFFTLLAFPVIHRQYLSPQAFPFRPIVKTVWISFGDHPAQLTQPAWAYAHGPSSPKKQNKTNDNTFYRVSHWPWLSKHAPLLTSISISFLQFRQ